MGGLELFVGGLTGVVGFISADVLDRVLATHALTAAGTNDSNGNAMYTDTPPTASTWRGNYSNLYNGTAVIAPMSIARWGIGLLLTAVPIGAAHFVKSPVGRSALQMFGFGAGMRVVGGGLVKILGGLTKKTAFGQRVFDAEIRANALYGGSANTLVGTTGTALTNTAGTQITPSVPTAGLGAPHTGLGDCGCMSCKQRFGTCGGGTQPPGQVQQPPASAPTPVTYVPQPVTYPPTQIVQPPISSPQVPPVPPPPAPTCPDGNVVIAASSVPQGIVPTYIVYKNTLNPSQAPQYQNPSQPAPPSGYIVGYCVPAGQQAGTGCPDGNTFIAASAVPAGVTPTYVQYASTLGTVGNGGWQLPSQPAPPGGYVIGYCVPAGQQQQTFTNPMAPWQPPQQQGAPNIPGAPQQPYQPIQIVKDTGAGFGAPLGYIPPSALAHGNN